MSTLTVALAQMAPRLGALEENLERHHELIGEARDDGADLVVFPELGLTGYLLQDLNAEVAMRRDDPRLLALAQAAEGMAAVVSFVEESEDHRLFIAAALLEAGAVRHVHRKVFLPTYGLFDERRFFAPGSRLRAVTSERLGLRLGISVCEDFWHLATPQLLALDGAQVLINVSSSPGRDVAAVNEAGLGTATSWRTLNRTYAQLTTSYVIFVNRVGVDESITFWGGSEVVSPTGQTRLRGARSTTRASSSPQLDPVAMRRERIATPLLRDERPEVVLRQLDDIMRDRQERSATSRRCRDDRSRRRRDALRAAARAGHRHDGRAAHHPRVHPRPAAPGRLRQGPAGSLGRHRLGARGLPRRGCHRSRQPAGRAHALPDLVPGVARRRRGGRAPAGLPERAGRHQRHGGRLLRGRRADATPRPCAAATSWPAPA